MSQSTLKKIAALRRCGGLLSRLACEHDRKEGVDVTGTPHVARVWWAERLIFSHWTYLAANLYGTLCRAYLSR
ncbi:MAG: hypothetical protein WCF53_04570, partial [Pseudolabrys sp.]